MYSRASLTDPVGAGLRGGGEGERWHRASRSRGTRRPRSRRRASAGSAARSWRSVDRGHRAGVAAPAPVAASGARSARPRPAATNRRIDMVFFLRGPVPRGPFWSRLGGTERPSEPAVPAEWGGSPGSRSRWTGYSCGSASDSHRLPPLRTEVHARWQLPGCQRPQLAVTVRVGAATGQRHHASPASSLGRSADPHRAHHQPSPCRDLARVGDRGRGVACSSRRTRCTWRSCWPSASWS